MWRYYLLLSFEKARVKKLLKFGEVGLAKIFKSGAKRVSILFMTFLKQRELYQDFKTFANLGDNTVHVRFFNFFCLIAADSL